jgi:hypothetical protein
MRHANVLTKIPELARVHTFPLNLWSGYQNIGSHLIKVRKREVKTSSVIRGLSILFFHRQ